MITESTLHNKIQLIYIVHVHMVRKNITIKVWCKVLVDWLQLIG